MSIENEFKASQLVLITKTQANLLDLMNEGVLSREIAKMYILELDKKFQTIQKQLTCKK